MQYVRSLEQRVKQLEEEKLVLQQKLGQVPGTNSTSGNWENDVRDQMYRISRPIRCTVIFSFEILEKNNDECILILVIYRKNRVVTYQN